MKIVKKYNLIILLILVIGCQSSSPNKSVRVENPISDLTGSIAKDFSKLEPI